MIIHGTREWTDHRVSANVTVHLGRYAGLTARVRGLRRFYAATLSRTGRFEILRVLDDDRLALASTPLDWHLDESVPMSMTVQGGRITARAGGACLAADDDRPGQLASGGAGLLVADGAVSVNGIRVSSPEADHGSRTPTPARP